MSKPVELAKAVLQKKSIVLNIYNRKQKILKNNEQILYLNN